MDTLRFERLARIIDAKADILESKIRALGPNDQSILSDGIVAGYREAARLVRNHVPTSIYSSSRDYPGWLTSVGYVCDVAPETSYEWWCCRESDDRQAQGFAASEDEAEKAMRMAMDGKDGSP